MAYNKTIWENLPSTNTPLNETNLNNMEDGIVPANVQTITTANTNLNNYTNAGSNGWLQVMASSGGIIKQIWYRQGTVNINDHETYVRTYSGGTWSNWKRYVVEDEIYFKSGDSYTFAAIECAGHLTSAQKIIQFSIVMPKRMDNVNISSISLSGLIRSSTGGYINSSDTFNFADYGTLAPSIRGNIISINYTLNNSTSFANNSMVACWITGTVNFN